MPHLPQSGDPLLLNPDLIAGRAMLRVTVGVNVRARGRLVANPSMLMARAGAAVDMGNLELWTWAILSCGHG